MFSNDLFSLGLTGPIVLLCLGVPTVELLFAGIVIVVRSRLGSKMLLSNADSNSLWAIRVLVISGLFPIFGLTCEVFGFYRSSELLTEIGIFVLWPLSAVLTIVGKGVGRRAILGGHGIIAAILFAIFWSVKSHGMAFPHFP